MQRPRILIVEHEAVIALFLQRALVRLGYPEAVVATTGPEAVALARIILPDLVLLESALESEDDGLAIAAQIQAEREVPCLFLSGARSTNSAVSSRSALRFMEDMVTVESLGMAIADALETNEAVAESA